MATKSINIEKHGWYVTIDILDVSKRPNWEIRVRITRSREGQKDIRGHRFYLSSELVERLGLEQWSYEKRRGVLSDGAKRVILREFNEIFAEPEGGLDSLRPLKEVDLAR